MVRHGIQQGPPIAGPRRIALITSSYPINGADYAGAFVPGFADALVHQGCEVTVLTQDKPGVKERPSAYEVSWFEWAGGSRPLVDMSVRSPKDVATILSLLRAGSRATRSLYRERRIEHCLALWAVPSGYFAWRARDTGVPYSVWALGSDIHTWARRPVVGSLVRAVLRGAAHRFADGLELAEQVKRISGGDCGFMPSTRRLPPAAATPTARRGLTFLFVGRLEPVKGADVLIDAMIALAGRGVDARLVMCGEGSLSDQLRRRTGAAGVEDRVEFAGSRPAATVAGYMQACDCLVIPSRMESIPIVFSEALQAGIPMLVTDVGDMGRLARENGLASPVRPADAGALASAMEAFARDVDGQRVLYRAAREKLLSVFDLEASAARFLATISAA